MPKIYESSVDTIRETFAVLIGFAVTEFIGDRFKEGGAADFTAWVLSLSLILLVLRLFIGTANHLETTYAEDEGGEFNRTTGCFLKDIGFLIAFGLMSVLIARSDPAAPESFLKRTMLLLLITSLWSVGDALWHWLMSSGKPRWYRWWLFCDSCQFLLTAVFWRWAPRLPGDCWLLPRGWGLRGLVLVLLFAGFFIVDVRNILKMRQFKATAAQPEPFSVGYAPLGAAALLGAVAVCWWSGEPAWPHGPL
ncbi:membrane hypothetical protein [Candidatus Sulfopaludibacter sp. SbA4]|nr:membrane hypothetical protein [Candidatus Sulfopaludibacter sp. SbA4]